MYYFYRFCKNAQFFPGRSHRENVPSFNKFWLVFWCLTSSIRDNYQKWVCVPSWAPRVKSVIFCPKIFSEILHTFCKVMYTHVYWCCAVFLHFCKITSFHREGAWGKMTHFSQIFGCFSVVKSQITGVTPENEYVYPIFPEDIKWN